MEYNTGTMKSVMMETAIPPNDGMAIGIMMSAPRPVDESTGSNASSEVAVVIRVGLIRAHDIHQVVVTRRGFEIVS